MPLIRRAGDCCLLSGAGQLPGITDRYDAGPSVLAPVGGIPCDLGGNLDFAAIRFELFLNFSKGLNYSPWLNGELGSPLPCNKRFWNDGWMGAWMDSGYGGGMGMDR